MASPVGRPPAASQGVAWQSGDVFCPISVATYNVGASQDVVCLGELDQMAKHQVYREVPAAQAWGRRVKAQWVDEYWREDGNAEVRENPPVTRCGCMLHGSQCKDRARCWSEPPRCGDCTETYTTSSGTPYCTCDCFGCELPSDELGRHRGTTEIYEDDRRRNICQCRRGARRCLAVAYGDGVTRCYRCSHGQCTCNCRSCNPRGPRGEELPVAAKFTNALGLVVPIPRCIAGLAECMNTIRREEQHDPTTQVQGEALPQLAIVTEQCTAPPTPVQPTASDLRSPTSPADEDEGETHDILVSFDLAVRSPAPSLENLTDVVGAHTWQARVQICVRRNEHRTDSAGASSSSGVEFADDDLRKHAVEQLQREIDEYNKKIVRLEAGMYELKATRSIEMIQGATGYFDEAIKTYMEELAELQDKLAELQDAPTPTPTATDEKVTLEVMAFGTVEMFNRPCVDCGRITGNFCDYCLAKDRAEDEEWAAGQRTPLCTPCDRSFDMCHFCRGQLWAQQPAWGQPQQQQPPQQHQQDETPPLQ